MTEWISVKDRLPNPYERILVLFKRDSIKIEPFVAYINNKQEWSLITGPYSCMPINKILLTPIYWQEIIMPPKTESSVC